jgi:hypothetical protein
MASQTLAKLHFVNTAIAALLSASTLSAQSTETVVKGKVSLGVAFGRAEPMPDLDAKFEQMEGWIGGDGAYSVAMHSPGSPKQTLWLFSDTWIGTVRQGKRNGATLVNNTLALQQGVGVEAKVKFIVAHDQRGKPASFITPQDKRGWFWPQAAIRAERTLFFFAAQIEKNGGGGAFGFKTLGKWLITVDNPDEAPAAWHISQKKLLFSLIAPGREVSFGAAAFCDEHYAYIYGTDEDRKTLEPERFLIVARAPRDHIGDLESWRFYGERGWTSDFRGAKRLAGDLASECSVHYLAAFKQYVLVYTERGLSPRILARTSDAPWGPWSDAALLYECPIVGRKADPNARPANDPSKSVFCYAAKAHPELAVGNELVISYVENSFDFWQVAADARLYWPRFVRVPIRTQD